MKKLFLYYSLTGNGDMLAPLFEAHDYQIRKVTEKKKMPKSFFWRVFAGGFRAGLNLKGKLVDYDNDVSEFEEIVIGSPIWNGRFPPAINAVLAQTDLSKCKLTFLFYSGSGEGAKASEKAKKLFKDPDIIFLQEPKKHEGELSKLEPLFK